MTPNSAEIARSERVRPPRHGRFHARRTSAPVRTRHHATDAGSTEAKATTASAAPHVLDEARADDVQLGRDTVGDQGALGRGGALAHEAGAKVSAAEFMQ